MPTTLADRTVPFLTSHFQRIFELSKQLKQPVNLGVGQPHFDVPVEIKNEAMKAIQQGVNGYTLPSGNAELRQLIKSSLDSKHAKNDEVIITCGTEGALTLALQSILNPDDEILILDPFFVAYPQLAGLSGAKVTYLSTYPDFQPDPEKVAQAISTRTKAIILCSPGNPTGVVTEPERVKALSQLADKKGIWLISDEIYSSFVYDQPYVSPASYGKNVIVCSSFSKTHALTGWRLGYAYGPAPLIRAMIAIQQATFVCAPSMAQAAGIVAWNYPMDAYVQDYRTKRDWLLNHLSPKYQVSKPGGAFYVFPRCPQGTASELAEAAIRKNLVIMPGMVFSQQDTHFRISYGVDDATLKQGVEILNSLV